MVHMVSKEIFVQGPPSLNDFSDHYRRLITADLKKKRIYESKMAYVISI
jgi:hypothetical protein